MTQMEVVITDVNSKCYIICIIQRNILFQGNELRTSYNHRPHITILLILKCYKCHVNVVFKNNWAFEHLLCTQFYVQQLQQYIIYRQAVSNIIKSQ